MVIEQQISARRERAQKHSAHSDPAGWELLRRLFRALGQQQNLPGSDARARPLR